MDEFPGGFTYHRRASYMKDLFAGNVDPIIFHMSWTQNKIDKQRFFKQSGFWYLQDKCIDSTAEKILTRHQPRTANTTLYPGRLLEPCCSAEPLTSCFYSDKPSVNPCRDSPPIDEGKPSFW